MKKLFLYSIYLILLIINTSSCSNVIGDSGYGNDITMNGNEADILHFSIPSQTEPAIIDPLNKTVDIEVHYRSDLLNIAPTIVATNDTAVIPDSNEPVDFSSGPVDYTVTANDGSEQIWTVNVVRGSFEEKILPGEAIEFGSFGTRLAISSDSNTIIVGTYLFIGSRSESVYIYRWNGNNYTWEETEFFPSDEISYNGFGSSVATSSDGNIVIVGSASDGDNGEFAGSVYIYRWYEEDKIWGETELYASDGLSNESFGGSVSISGDGNTLAVSHSCFVEFGDCYATVYMFRWNDTSKTWEESKLTDDDRFIFGSNVSISTDGNTVIAGVPSHRENGTASGAVFIYKWNDTDSVWEEEKILASNGSEYDQFGSYVSISSDGNTAVVSNSGAAIADEDSGDVYGIVYVYRWDGFTWEESKILTPSTGSKASISGDAGTVVVGFQGMSDSGIKTGVVYMYRWNSAGLIWEESRLTPSNGQDYDFFGGSISASYDGNTVLVGAHGDDDNGDNAGSAYIYYFD